MEGISHEEGLSTDEEETKSELVARQQALGNFIFVCNILALQYLRSSSVLAEIREASAVIFIDAVDDYCQVGKIVSRFVDWLAADESSFADAYIQLFIPKLLSPFIRLEMLCWDPLEVTESY